MDQPRISIIVPAYNEGESLPVLLAELRSALAPIDEPWELLAWNTQLFGRTEAEAEKDRIELALQPIER